MRFLASALVLATLLAATRAPALTPPPPAVYVNFPFVVVSPVVFSNFRSPPPAFTAPLTMVNTQNPDGSVDLSVQGGKTSVTRFGPGLDQAFTADAFAVGFARANVGYVRLFASARADVSPTSYGQGSPGVLGDNPYESYAAIGMAGEFYDVIVPPPTTANPSGPTYLTVLLQVSCAETFDFNGGESLQSGLTWMARDVFTQIDGQTLIYPIPTGESPADCGQGATFSPVSVGPMTVGTPVLMHFSAAVGATMLAGVNIDYQGEVFAGGTYAIDELNTAYVVVKDADGNPVTGESGVTYGGEPALDPITTTTTTSTTTTLVTSTTLPGCDPSAYCGDGVHQPDCGEACDCPPPAPGQVATICAANVAVPDLDPSCALCNGCQVDVSACTTTTTPRGSTTSSTVAPTTTTTTLPGGCDLAQLPEASLAGVQCAVTGIQQTLTGPPESDCARHCHCGLSTALTHVSTPLAAAQQASTPKRCKRKLAAVRTAARDLGKQVHALVKRSCLAPTTLVAALQQETADLTSRAKALSASDYCTGK